MARILFSRLSKATGFPAGSKSVHKPITPILESQFQPILTSGGENQSGENLSFFTFYFDVYVKVQSSQIINVLDDAFLAIFISFWLFS